MFKCFVDTCRLSIHLVLIIVVVQHDLRSPTQHQGERGGGVLPNFTRRVAMPEIPFGVSIPKTVVAAEFLPASQRPLPYGTLLAPGVRVLSPDQAAVTKVKNRPSTADEVEQRRAENVANIVKLLPLNAVLVSREPWAVLPPDVERGSRSTLPSGLLLGPNVEILLLSVRFELPPGVRLQPGVILGR